MSGFVSFKDLYFPKATKAIAFVDADQLRKSLLYDISTNLKGVKVEFVMTRDSIPRMLRNKGLDITLLSDMKPGKEATDKYISLRIQKAIADGYNQISVMSADYDYIDIFKMMIICNKDMKDVKFRLLVPKDSVKKDVVSISKTNTIETVML